MPATPFPPLVSTAWLADHLGDLRLRVLDASWYLPSANRDPRAEYAAGHVPGARFFDLDRASAHDTPLPHMLPPADDFARYVGQELGVGDGDDVVVYDGSGTNLSAARVWWMFRAFGHASVAVLDGGLRKWVAEGRPLESRTPSVEPARFTATLDRARVRDLAAMRELVRADPAARPAQIVDMRPAGRFAGRDPEPRAGLRAGHMPGSASVPFTELVRPDGTVLPENELRERLAAAGVRLDRPIVASCGSGTSACSLLLNLERLGVRDAALYDGSWSEWGAQADTPVATD
ncbi:MAG TPA: 3-mercaptopyruvate sulfurtransferase [Gemmatimonadaceae bacterium]|nr:3-mercaptopyruvate sulfurtransferase [Gemmatimonadaceae bacterium]